MRPDVPEVSEKKWGKTTESDRHPNPNPSPFCMEWKQIVYFWWQSDTADFPKWAWHVVFVVDISLLPHKYSFLKIVLKSFPDLFYRELFSRIYLINTGN